MSERSLISALKRKYRQSDYCVLSQVRLPSGISGRSRIVDGLVVGLRQARDPFIYGYEMKSSRGDWQTELANPQKAEDVAQFCNTWSVVADPNVVLLEEVPRRWGLYVVRRGSLEEEKAPDQLSPTEPNRAFLGAILEAIAEQISPKVATEVLQARYDQGFSDGVAQGKKGANEAMEVLEDRIVTLKGRAREESEFLERLGIRSTHAGCHLPKLEQACQVMELINSRPYTVPFETFLESIKFVLNGGMKTISSDLSQMRLMTEDILTTIHAAAAIAEPSGGALDQTKMTST